MDTVFVARRNSKTPGFNIASIFDKKMVTGEVGLEIEVEGNKFPKNETIGSAIPLPWVYHKDGSLRGQDNAEYVLKAPIKFDAVPDAIKILWDLFAAYGSKLDVSNRTSVHVHLNAQKFHLNRLAAFLGMYFSVEEMLTEWCGDHRVGNLFCLRAKDATAIVTHLKKFIQADGSYELREGLHYAGLNAHALYKFGSIEIRSLRGCTEPQTILDWVAILRRIYEKSADFPDPRLIPDSLSSDGPMAYLDMVLGEHRSTVINGIGWTIDKVRGSLYEGIRLAQDICYCRDWSLYSPVEMKSDPFGRPAKKVASSLSHLAQALVQNQASFNMANQIGDQIYQVNISTPPPPTPVGWSLPHETIDGEQVWVNEEVPEMEEGDEAEDMDGDEQAE